MKVTTLDRVVRIWVPKEWAESVTTRLSQHAGGATNYKAAGYWHGGRWMEPVRVVEVFYPKKLEATLFREVNNIVDEMIEAGEEAVLVRVADEAAQVFSREVEVA